MARKNYTFLSLPVVFPTGTSAIDLITGFTPGFRGKIVGWDVVADVAATGDNAAQVLNLEINAVDVTGSSFTLALADVNAIGKVKAGGTPTALNEFDENDTISVELAASGTAFTAGSGHIVLKLEQSTRGY